MNGSAARTARGSVPEKVRTEANLGVREAKAVEHLTGERSTDCESVMLLEGATGARNLAPAAAAAAPRGAVVRAAGRSAVWLEVDGRSVPWLVAEASGGTTKYDSSFVGRGARTAASGWPKGRIGETRRRGG